MVCTHGGVLLSRQKDQIVSLVTTGLDLEGIMPSELSQTDKGK